MGKYKVEKALELFRVAADYGFGDTIDQVTPTKRRVKKFRKTPYSLLSTDARGILRDIRITENDYRSSFASSSPYHVLTENNENIPPPTLPDSE